MAQEYLIRAGYISESKSNVNSSDENSDFSIIDKIDIMIKEKFFLSFFKLIKKLIMV